MVAIWNEVVVDGIAFPQEELLDSETGAEFFASQSYCGVAEVSTGHPHPHIPISYCVSVDTRFGRRTPWNQKS